MTKRISATAAITAALLATCLVGTATARDVRPCGAPYHWDPIGQTSPASWWMQNCPLWRERVPLYYSSTSSYVVGYLHGKVAPVSAGIGQFKSTLKRVGPFWSRWWAVAYSPKDWGYVNQAYFAGALNNERDSGLRQK